MAMDVGGAKGGVKSDINVTPLVDVMLVLLIIVMSDRADAAAGRCLNCLRRRTSSDKPDTSDQTVVYVDAHSKFYVNTIEVTKTDLASRLQDVLENTTEKHVSQG